MDGREEALGDDVQEDAGEGGLGARERLPAGRARAATAQITAGAPMRKAGPIMPSNASIEKNRADMVRRQGRRSTPSGPSKRSLFPRSARMTVALTILSIELPAASRMAAMLVRHCRVCS